MSDKLQIVMLKTKDIKPYERNNKKHPKEQIDKLAKQIEAHKFDVPIVVDENNVILKGHGRLLAAKQLKMKEVPCIIRTDLTENQKKAARIADNKLGELAEIDLDNLNLEMIDLQLGGMEVELTGFSDWILEPEFTPDLPDENKDNVSPEEKLVLIVTLENQGDKQQLFNELRDRGYKVKV